MEPKSEVSGEPGSEIHFPEVTQADILSDWERWKKISKFVRQALADPYTLAWDLNKVAQSQGITTAEMLKTLFTALVQAPSLKRAQALDRWTQSEQQAVFLYELLSDWDLKSYAGELKYLTKYNLYFSDTNPILVEDGEVPTLATFSYEKESSNPKIVKFYKDPKFSDTEWFQLAVNKALSYLKNIAGQSPQRTFLSASAVAPTAEKPDSLGGYSEEETDSEHPEWGYEVAHKKFEISRARAMQQVRKMAQFFGETHSFHFTSVFELPKKKISFRIFRRWYKHTNDFFYLSGLEEGLHGNDLTQLMNLPEKITRQVIEANQLAYLYANSFEDIGETGLKMFSLGLRGGEKYGPALSRGNTKIGLELRDVTRDMNKLDSYTQSIAASVARRVWTQVPEWKSGDRDISLRLTNMKEPSLALLNEYFPADIALELYSLNNTVALPLMAFEQSTYYDFKAKKWTQPSAIQKQRILRARLAYIDDLKKLEKEIIDLKAQGKPAEDEDAAYGIKWCISDWAKLAKVSELYSGF